MLDAQAANHEEAHYGSDDYLFKPERFLNMPFAKGTSAAHFGFGAESQMCAGHLIATRFCYCPLVRFMLSFGVVQVIQIFLIPIILSIILLKRFRGTSM